MNMPFYKCIIKIIIFKEEIVFNCVFTIRCQGMECYKVNGRKTGRTVSAINAPLFFNLNLKKKFQTKYKFYKCMYFCL